MKKTRARDRHKANVARRREARGKQSPLPSEVQASRAALNELAYLRRYRHPPTYDVYAAVGTGNSFADFPRHADDPLR